MAKYFDDSMKQSWVDLFTNEAFVAYRNSTSLGNILMSYQFPKEIFFPFIHEATHHWTFDSLLVNSLFVLKVRSFINAINFETDFPVDKDAEADFLFENTARSNRKYDIYTDYARVKTVDTILKPLAEGMALFAEFDTYPSRTNVCPSFIAYATVVFSNISRFQFDKTDMASFENSYREFLIERRFVSGEGLLKKARVLSTSKDIFENPYFAGYLVVKCIQLVLYRQYEQFSDPNFFLQFIKDFFYDDTEFIELILNDKTKDEHIVPTLCDYFQNRLRSLLSITPSFIEDFERSYTKKYTPFDFTKTESEIDPETSPLLFKLNAELNTLRLKYNLSGLEVMRLFFRATHIPCYMEINQSQVAVYEKIPLSILSEEAISKILQDDRAFKDDQFIYRPTVAFGINTGNKDYKGEAFMEKYISFRDITRHFTAFQFDDTYVFAPFSDSSLSIDETTWIINYFTSSRLKLANIEFDTFIESIWDKDDPLITEIEDFHKNNNFAVLQEIYQSRAFHCTGNAYQSIDQTIRENGFFDLLGETKYLEILVFLSIFSSNKCILKSVISTNEIYSSISQKDIDMLNKKLEDAGFLIFSNDAQKICTNCI